MGVKNILLIDDDPNLRKTLSDILKMEGYETFSVASGAEGMHFMDETLVNLVVIDLGLPDMSGLDVLSSVRKDGSNTEAIVLTGNSSLDAAIEATNRGAFSYLLKPYDITQLMLHVRRALEKQDVEESLRRSEERYRLLAENACDTIWTFDMTGKITYVSPSVRRLLGYTPEEFMNRSISETLSPESAKYVLVDLQEILRMAAAGEKIEGRIHEIEYKCKTGGTIWTEVNINELQDASGRIVGFIGIARDISERKKAEDERSRLIAQLREALAKIKTLTGLIPICSVCKNIRNDRGSWQQMEVYISDHSDADFSHGICPECMKKLYPDVDMEE